MAPGENEFDTPALEESQMDIGWQFVAGAGPCSHRLSVLTDSVTIFCRHESSFLKKAPLSPVMIPEWLSTWMEVPLVMFSRGSAAPCS